MENIGAVVAMYFARIVYVWPAVAAGAHAPASCLMTRRRAPLVKLVMSMRCATVPAAAFEVSVNVALFVPEPPRYQQSGTWSLLASSSSDGFGARLLGSGGGGSGSRSSE